MGIELLTKCIHLENELIGKRCGCTGIFRRNGCHSYVDGADIVVHSGTKYLDDTTNTLSGFLVTSDLEISERLRFLIKTTGAGKCI